MSSRSAMVAPPVRQFPRERLWSLVDPLERAGSLLLIILLAPFMVATSAVIIVLSGRSPLVAHRRIGQFGIPFWTLKFRSMWAGRSPGSTWIEYIIDDSGPEYKNSGDPRVTSRFARFCRQFSVDELPQLVN